MEIKTQKSEILKYLKEHKKDGLTSIQAIDLFGATRLSGTIFDLKKDGHIIITEIKSVKNRFGGTSNIATYYYKGELNGTIN